MNKFLFTFLALLLIGNLSAQTQKLIGTNMESVDKWSTSLLNTATGFDPTATWNYTTVTPANGAGGNLHVTGVTTAGNSQYCIYQAVTLSKEKKYTFDGAFKAIQINNSWCEVFIGKKPVDGVDYTTSDGTRVAAFGTWASYTNSDGKFSTTIDPNNYKTFIPDTDGEYYLVLKMGSTSWDNSSQTFEIIVDELSLLEEDSKPIANFVSNATEGFLPFAVQFTDKSRFATSWAWDFGDGNTSDVQNPSHTYTTQGTYTVKLTATNALDNDVMTKTDMIKVNPMQVLTGGGVLKDGNMENGTANWSVSTLNSPSDKLPVASWNNTTKVASAGQGGGLFVTGNCGGVTVQYAIFQKVTLSADKTYDFNAAVKDFSTGLDLSWIEVFIAKNAPVDGSDFGANADNIQIANFSTWNGDCSHAGLDGTFGNNSCSNQTFIPQTSGDYYFVFKVGSFFAGTFEIAIDELSLTETRVKPIPAFTANKPVGFAPLAVQFTEASTFATSWAWDFGDGNSSTLQNPLHTYTQVGTYTVTLTATNEIGSTELKKTDFIKVNSKPELPDGQKLYGGNMEDPNLWNITQLNATATSTATWNNTQNTMTAGAGGNLHIEASVINATAQYCIWQEVELTAGKIYTFTAAFKDLSTKLDHFWSEVFIGTTAPADGADYGTGQTKISFFNTWDCSTGAGVDGTYQTNGCGYKTFTPETSGTYYFAIKTGVIDWENKPFAYSVLIDEVSLMESENVEASFFADVTSGDAPLTVTFTNLSTNSTSWEWTFGDGGISVEKNPTYVYSRPGKYTVTLIARNGNASDTETATDLINVTGTNGIGDIGHLDKISVYPNPNNGQFYLNLEDLSESTVEIYNAVGKKIITQKQTNLESEMKFQLKEKGIYFVKISNNNENKTLKVVVQ